MSTFNIKTIYIYIKEDNNKEALDMFSFSIICCTVKKYVPPDPWRSFSNSFSKGSVENVPSKT